MASASADKRPVSLSVRGIPKNNKARFRGLYKLIFWKTVSLGHHGSGCFFDSGFHYFEHGRFSLDHLACNNEVFYLLFRRQDVHRFEKDLFHDHHQAAGSDLSFMGLLSDRTKRVVGEFQPDVVELELTLVLLYERVLRLGQDLYQRGLIEFLQCSDNR